MSLAQIDYSLMPAPAVIEELDFETILAEIKADLLIRDPSLTLISLESEPITKLLESIAYRELNYRQRVNDAAHARMLPFAVGADLDYIALDYGVTRFVIVPADNTVTPPVAAILETDASLRARTLLAVSAKTTAGSANSYKFYARVADADVRDAAVMSPAAGTVTVSLLSQTGDGTAGPTLIGLVGSVLDGDNVRPLTDQVSVQSATIVPFTITAEITIYPGQTSADAQARALASLNAWLDTQHMIGFDITLAGMQSALMVAGVQNVSITAPAADIVIDNVSASYCTSVTLTVAAQAVQ